MAGGRLQIVSAYSVIRALRHFGCQLPVELYYAGASEMSAEVVLVLNELDVLVLDIYHSLDERDAELPLRGFQIKVYAVYLLCWYRSTHTDTCGAACLRRLP